VPSWAVTTTVMVFAPTAKGMPADALPEATAVPFTVAVATVLVGVGVTVMVDVPLVSATV